MEKERKKTSNIFRRTCALAPLQKWLFYVWLSSTQFSLLLVAAAFSLFPLTDEPDYTLHIFADKASSENAILSFRCCGNYYRMHIFFHSLIRGEVWRCLKEHRSAPPPRCCIIDVGGGERKKKSVHSLRWNGSARKIINNFPMHCDDAFSVKNVRSWARCWINTFNRRSHFRVHFSLMKRKCHSSASSSSSENLWKLFRFLSFLFTPQERKKK